MPRFRIRSDDVNNLSLLTIEHETYEHKLIILMYSQRKVYQKDFVGIEPYYIMSP